VLGAIIDCFPGEQLEPRAEPFFTLARAIAGQQIWSGRRRPSGAGSR
jgi:hypothetical protein